MALFDAATIDISMSDVFVTDDSLKNTPPQRVHLLVAEYAKHKHALVVCELTELTKDANVCADPPTILYSVGFPNERLSFTFEQANGKVIVSAELTASFALTFVKCADFWKVVRIVAEAQAAEAVHCANIKQLLKDVMSTIPTLTLLPAAAV